MIIILWLISAAFLFIFLSGLYVFVQACVRKKELPWLVEEEIKKTSFSKYYNCIVASNAWLKDHNAQDVYVTSNDGLKLHAFWVPAESPRGTVLLAHGYRSTMLVDFGLAFAFYHALGMNILVPNQRAHGESEGRYITFGVKESEDMKCWIAFHNQQFGNYQLILSGLSMGASTMLYLADQKLPFNVKCIIADCGFSSPKAILDVVYRSVVHIPSGPSLWAADLFARLLAHFSFNDKDTTKSLRNARVPVLMIHGLSDDFVPSYMTQQGFDACNGSKELLLVNGAGHGTSFLVDREGYTKCVISFLEKCLEDF